jgi:Putative lumazine-binding
MKTMKAFLPILAISAFAFSGQVMADTQSDVTTTLEQHFSGIKEGKLELLNQSWDAKVASITEIKNDKTSKVDLEQAFALWTKQANPEFSAKVESITEISGSIAVAKVSIIWKGAQYSDALTLSKGTEGWKIISKVYQAPKKAKGSYSLDE